MAYQQIAGQGLWVPDLSTYTVPAGYSAGLVIDATGEKIGLVGRVWFKERTGTKDISRVGFRFGTITKAGGSGLTVSLQDISLTSGAPTTPDETQDQTVAIANGDANFASNTWYRTDALSANRTVTYGDLLAVVIEYDGSGRLGADSVVVSSYSLPSGTQRKIAATPSLKTGGSWAAVNVLQNVVLEFSDGSFGTLDGSIPTSALTSTNINSGTNPDEYALAFSLPMRCKADGLRAIVSISSACDFDMILYRGTTALQTVNVDPQTVGANAINSIMEVPIPETEIIANTVHYVAVRPNTATNMGITYMEVADANHFQSHAGGPDFNYSTRNDGGSWSAVTTTRRFNAFVRLSSFEAGGPFAVGF